MSASLKPLTMDDFLAWERSQPERYEFDGVQPVAMTGASFGHARLVARLVVALRTRLRRGCEAVAGDVKVATPPGRVRYPDASIVCGPVPDETDTVLPVVVFEVLSPSTALVDRTVKAMEYQGVDSILAYVILEQDRPEAAVRRRSEAWTPLTVAGRDAVLALPEVGIEVPLAELYAPPAA